MSSLNDDILYNKNDTFVFFNLKTKNLFMKRIKMPKLCTCTQERFFLIPEKRTPSICERFNDSIQIRKDSMGTERNV